MKMLLLICGLALFAIPPAEAGFIDDFNSMIGVSDTGSNRYIRVAGTLVRKIAIIDSTDNDTITASCDLRAERLCQFRSDDLAINFRIRLIEADDAEHTYTFEQRGGSGYFTLIEGVTWESFSEGIALEFPAETHSVTNLTFKAEPIGEGGE